MTEFREITQEYLDELRSNSQLLNLPSDQVIARKQRRADKAKRDIFGEALTEHSGLPSDDVDLNNPLGKTGLFCNTQPSDNNSQQATSSNDSRQVTMLNGESTRFAARVHWLQGTFRYDEHPQLLILGEKLELIFEDTIEWGCGAFTRGIKFQDSAKSSTGIIMAWQRPRDSKPGMCWLSIPGSSLDRLIGEDGDDARIYMLFHLLLTGTCGSTGLRLFSRWKTTRIDTAIDDFEKKVRPADVLTFAKSGDFTGFRNEPVFDEHQNKWLAPTYDWHESPSCQPDGTVLPSGTLTFGSSQSDKRLTIYDKFLESNGAIESVRWEARWADEYAQVRFNAICKCLFEESQQTLPQLLASMTTGAIDFIDISSATRVCNCKRLPFWEEMLSQIGRVKYPLQMIVKTIEDTVDWIEHQVSTSLAMIEQIAGTEDLFTGFYELRELGASRLNKHHKMKIDQAKKDGFNFLQYLYQLLEKRRGITDRESLATC